jgi:DNA-directed RNA polymerase specialized sigma24 family protein
MKKKSHKQKKLTSLSNEEAKNFLSKYERIIFLESQRRSKLTGIEIDDLAQCCREKLLAGFHTFNPNISSEKTWASHVIRNTINGIWNSSLKQKRTNFLQKINEDKKTPTRDISLSEYKEQYFKIADDKPIYGTTAFSPEEYFLVLEALTFLKVHLPEESYSFIKKSLLEELEKNIPTNIKKTNYKLKNPKDFNIWSIFSDLKENVIRILGQIADFFINFLGFEKKQILGRTKTIDLSL